MFVPRSWQHVMFPVALVALAALACTLGIAPDSKIDVTALQTQPLVQLLAPVHGSTYAEGVQIEFYAIAQDSLAGVARMEFRVNSLPVGEAIANDLARQPSLEARITWTAAVQQKHLIEVEAFRADGSSLGQMMEEIEVVGKPVAQALDGSSPTPVPALEATLPPPLSPVPVDMGILTGPIARVDVDSLNIRQGPGTHYGEIGTLTQGNRVQILGRSAAVDAEDNWWAIAYGEGTAWIFASLTTLEGDASQVLLVAVP